jgi:gamma-glutamylcyclotransferase (GGCT)/AIG2-like uncharacterized protein YtfP
MSQNTITRLAVYGSLGPGRPNHHHLAGLGGVWTRGTVRGRLQAMGWGAQLGFPGLRLDTEGEEIAVDLLESALLADHWERLDAFEGSEYRRVMVNVDVASRSVEAFIYVLAD